MIWLFEKSLQAVTGLNFLFAGFANAIAKAQIRVEGWLEVIWASISATFEFITKNAFIFWENVGRAFRMIPEALWGALDSGIEKVEKFLNTVSNGVNNFAKKLWFEGDIVWSVSLGRIWGEKKALESGFKSYEKFNTSVIKSIQERTQREIDIQDDALKLTAQRLTKEANMREASLRGENISLWGSTTSSKGGWAVGKAKDTAEELKKLKEKEEKEEYERLQRRKKWLEDQEEAKQKKLEETAKKVDELYKEGTEIFAEGIEASKKKIDELQKEITSVLDEIKKIDEELAGLDKKRATTLGERNVEIEKELAKLREEGSQDVLRINELLEEQRLIRENASSDELKEAQRRDALSPTEKFLEDLALEKKLLEEKKILKEQELADLELQKVWELAVLENYTLEKEALDERYKTYIAGIEEQITNKLREETDKRIEALKKVEAQAIATANALRKAGMSTGSTATASSSTTNNNTVSPTVIVNATMSNNMDVQNVGNQLADIVTLSSKGIK